MQSPHRPPLLYWGEGGKIPGRAEKEQRQAFSPVSAPISKRPPARRPAPDGKDEMRCENWVYCWRCWASTIENAGKSALCQRQSALCLYGRFSPNRVVAVEKSAHTWGHERSFRVVSAAFSKNCRSFQKDAWKTFAKIRTSGGMRHRLPGSQRRCGAPEGHPPGCC